jgi:quercetin dioxygenase-like cupin family protein
MRRSFVVAVVTTLSALARGAIAQSSGFGICVPDSERAGKDVGCFIVAEQPQGIFGAKPVFWHVTAFDTPAAAERARTGNGTVIQAFGRTWLMSIGDSTSRADSGTSAAVIGPLPITPGIRYSATYMEASMRPGMKSTIHRHPGPEAWYTLEGETCLETPDGTQVGRRGGPPVIVPGGLPMELTATGTALRKSIVLILHDAAQPSAVMVATWKPRGLCGR